MSGLLNRLAPNVNGQPYLLTYYYSKIGEWEGTFLCMRWWRAAWNLGDRWTEALYVLSGNRRASQPETVSNSRRLRRSRCHCLCLCLSVCLLAKLIMLNRNICLLGRQKLSNRPLNSIRGLEGKETLRHQTVGPRRFGSEVFGGDAPVQWCWRWREDWRRVTAPVSWRPHHAWKKWEASNSGRCWCRGNSSEWPRYASASCHVHIQIRYDTIRSDTMDWV